MLVSSSTRSHTPRWSTCPITSAPGRPGRVAGTWLSRNATLITPLAMASRLVVVATPLQCGLSRNRECSSQPATGTQAKKMPPAYRCTTPIQEIGLPIGSVGKTRAVTRPRHHA